MTFRAAPDEEVLFHEEGGEAFLLHVASGQYFGLNRSGVVIWKAVCDGLDPVDELARRWPEVRREALERDAAELLGSLLEAGLVLESSGPGSTENGGADSASAQGGT